VASLVTDQGIIHYEAYGRGRPVLLLHGWMNSWALWRSTIEALGKEFRTYALDFWGFGESDTQDRTFTVSNFVEMVAQFMDKLGIVKAPLIGHSMGGTVALSTAIRYPEKVVKVGVIGSPINGSSLSPLLKLAAWNGWVSLANAAPFMFNPVQRTLQLAMRGYGFLVSRDGAAVGQMLASDVSKLSVFSFLESIGTLRKTDLRGQLDQIKIPTLGIYGKTDIIVHPRQYQLLKEGIKHAQIEWYPNAGHFPMNDDPERFIKDVRDFLAAKIN
jgi:pimeloyl-ACP methyl ester carboxylesterase